MLSALAIPFTAAASVLHGGNWYSKGYIMAAHALLCYLLIASPLGIIASALFWYVYRTGKIARAELTCITKPTEENFNAVWRAYVIPNLITTALVSIAVVCAGAYPLVLAATPLWAGLVIPYIAVRHFNHTARPNLLAREVAAQQAGSTDKIWDCRRYQELITGAYSGYAVCIALLALLALGDAYAAK